MAIAGGEVQRPPTVLVRGEGELLHHAASGAIIISFSRSQEVSTTGWWPFTAAM